MIWSLWRKRSRPQRFDVKAINMKKALIIGAAGFVGKYLLAHLSAAYSWELYATKLPHEHIDFADAQILDLDIMKKEDVQKLLDEVQPDYIFHLAAQSSVALSWKKPELTVDINIKGSLNLLDAVRDSGLTPHILLIGSGEEYGHIAPESVPVTEETVLHPGNLYAATKACQNMIGTIYAQAYGMHVVMVRAFNHIGPEQLPAFVVADFCRQVAAIEKGSSDPVMRVGNLSAKRDFTDVRDVVRAYGLLIQDGVPGETYNIGSGHAIAIQELLEHILKLSTSQISVETDPAKLRPVDVPIIEADISKLTGAISWKPEIPLDTTLLETLNYWRKQLDRGE